MPSYVIVGASRGIGYQFLKTLSANPDNTIIGLVRNVAPTQAQVDADKLPNVHILEADITSASALSAAAEKTATITNDVVDHLIVNAAYLPYNTPTMTPVDFSSDPDLFASEFDLSMRTNVAGPLYAINAFLPLVKKSAVKKVICISSGHANEDLVRIAQADFALSYTLSKSALNMLVLKYAVSNVSREDGVIFLALAPGVVNTFSESYETASEEYKQSIEFMKKYFQKIDPSWERPIQPEQSVREMMEQIEKVTIGDSGKFMSQHGNDTWL